MVQEIARLRHAGEDVSGLIYQSKRLEQLQRQALRELGVYARYANDQIMAQQAQALRDGLVHSQALLRSAGEGVSGLFHQLPYEALQNLVGITQDGSPLLDVLQRYAGNAANDLADALIQGVALGQGPRLVARQAQRAFGGALWEMLRLTRTETLRAYRTASLETYRENGDILEGWVWMSARNERTCAMCWVMDGTLHSVYETLDDHPNGRCTSVPKIRGIDLPLRGTGVEAFGRLSEVQQLKILRPAKFAAWKDGAIKLEDLVGQRYDPRWGTMRYERSLMEVLGREEASYWIDKSREIRFDRLSSSLGAAVNPYAELQFERLNQLTEMDPNDFNALILKMRSGGNLPKLKYHFEKHGNEVGAMTVVDYQNKMNEFLKLDNLQFYSVMQKNQYKMWYLLDIDTGFVVKYNESQNRYWSFYRSENIGKLIESGQTWWIKIDVSGSKPIFSKL